MTQSAPSTKKDVRPTGIRDPQRPPEAPSDVVASAAAETKRDHGVCASMRRAALPYVENHRHAVLYGVVGFITAVLILIIGFWPTALLAAFAVVGVVVGAYQDGDRATRARMRSLLDRFN